MRRKIHPHPVRTWAAAFVLLSQINLLWVAILHRHEEEAVPARATAVRGAERQSRPMLETRLICTACQIVRNSAARPTLGTPAPNPAASSPIRLTVDASESPFHARYVAYGRAPPLG